MQTWHRVWKKTHWELLICLHSASSMDNGVAWGLCWDPADRYMSASVYFFAASMDDTHYVGSVTFTMVPFAYILSNDFLTFLACNWLACFLNLFVASSKLMSESWFTILLSLTASSCRWHISMALSNVRSSSFRRIFLTVTLAVRIRIQSRINLQFLPP